MRRRWLYARPLAYEALRCALACARCASRPILLLFTIHFFHPFFFSFYFGCYVQNFGAFELSRLRAVSLKHELAAIYNTSWTLRNLFGPLWVEIGSLV